MSNSESAVRRALVEALYLWTRDAKINVTADGPQDDKDYLANQIEHLGQPGMGFSDKEREDWARAVVETIEQRWPAQAESPGDPGGVSWNTGVKG